MTVFALQWGAQTFKNMLVVPPGSGIVHQVNLEYLARVVFDQDGLLYPDSVVGTDSHTTMINGLGVVGWGVGGIEAEAVMLGIKSKFNICITRSTYQNFNNKFRAADISGSATGYWLSDYRKTKSIGNIH